MIIGDLDIFDRQFKWCAKKKVYVLRLFHEARVQRGIHGVRGKANPPSSAFSETDFGTEEESNETAKELIEICDK